MRWFAFAIAVLLTQSAIAQETARHTFVIGDTDFLLDGKPLVIRSGEMHAARIPHEYWRHRLRMVRAMGCNAVCAYLFWNQHEPKPGKFDFTGQADAAEYCRIAQQEGLWVILRPGPYACAEWDFGGFPYWLLKTPDLKLRTRDPRFLEPATRYIRRVGQELAPLQITRGGPILMVQVENEYGSYGDDKEYIGLLRDALRGAGFDVPLFTCDGPSLLKNDVRDDLFCVVNFGGDPTGAFEALRAIRPKGPLMCGEYYPGWFDSWGKPHHTGDPKRVVADLAYMLENRQSFSIYMVHGGTSFGFSAGANSPPFRPQTTSYDYDAPIDEAGRATPKFHAIRELFSKHLTPGETLPQVPTPPMPIIAIPEIRLTHCSPLFANTGESRPADPNRERQRPASKGNGDRMAQQPPSQPVGGVRGPDDATPVAGARGSDSGAAPKTMEALDQPYGMLLYRTQLAAGPAGQLRVTQAHDIATAFLDGQRVGAIDRRWPRQGVIDLCAREQPQRLDILVEAFGRVNYGPHIFDNKGLTQRVEIVADGAVREIADWQVFGLPLDAAHLARLQFAETHALIGAPAFYRGEFDLSEIGDTFLDLRRWPRGMVWVNSRNLGRYWNIGPQQTLYLPGCWLNRGKNEIVVLDAAGQADTLAIAGLREPILDELHPEANAPRPLRQPGQSVDLRGVAPIHEGAWPASDECQQANFAATRGRYVIFETLSSQRGDAFASCAELRVLDDAGTEVPPDACKVIFADSEELDAEDGAATNVLDNDPATIWHTQWETKPPPHPHVLVIDLGQERLVSGIRYLPRRASPNGRVREFRVYLSSTPLQKPGP
ncbi:MAG: beta-galactosidase [Phycisphaerae bacterium]